MYPGEEPFSPLRELILRLFASTEPFLVGSGKILFFLQCRWNSHADTQEGLL